MTARWTEDLSVGVEAIDSQHRELFAAADALVAAVGRAEGRAEVAKTIVFLEGYVENHFQMEEMYMKRHSYPGYPDHKIEHTAFIADFYDLRQELDNDGATPELAARLADRLADWLVGHIGRMDRALADFLRRRR